MPASLSQLTSQLRTLDSAAVAFSAGVDSSLLLVLAAEALGTDKVLAVTARSHSFPQRELEEARSFCKARGIRQKVIDSEELDIEGFASNPPNRCYLCKKKLFSEICSLAAREGLAAVLDGSNLDDESDYRPGMRALAEQGVISPLRAAGFTKDDIRALSRTLGLPTADKQSFACLASRFPYGETISAAGLARIDAAEHYLLDLGLRQVRVRCHGGVLARIETDAAGMDALTTSELRKQVAARLKELGFSYVSLDLGGYRSGSMNETLP
jgi:uncharacterized protein